MRRLFVCSILAHVVLLFGCDGVRLGAPRARDGSIPGDAGLLGSDAGASSDASPSDAAVLDAAASAPVDAAPGVLDAATPPPLGPPAARPPAGPPDGAAVIAALAAQRPDLLAGSCMAMGGTNDFLLEAVRRLHALDARYGLTLRDGAMMQDRVTYYWGDGWPEGSTDVYVIDVIARHCAPPGSTPASPGWGDDSAAGGVWMPPVAGSLPPPDPPPTILPLPDASGVVRALAAERPDLLAASCVPDGGNNEFLFELVRRLRAIDPRWGLNWKRANVGDMSQDVVDYYYAPGAPIDGAFETYVVDVIGGHCGPSPSPAWNDVTALGTMGARWTLAGRSDLGP